MDFLDLAGRASPVIDLDALSQPQFDDILLARDLTGHYRPRECEQRAADHQQRKTSIAVAGHTVFPWLAKQEV
jgi:hypothetical protein